MSRVLFDWCPESDSFPRVSGDEPYQVDNYLAPLLFSPRERG